MLQYMLLFFSFINGVILLALEVISSKMVGSYFGTSYHVWGVMLLTTLISIALGYAAAMKIIQKKRELHALLLFVFLQLLFTTLILMAGNTIIHSFISMNFYIGLLLAFIILFLPIFAVLCTQSPLLISVMENNNRSSLVAAVFSISTLGGVFGIYFVSFYFLPYYGVKNSLFVLLALNTINLLIILYQFRKRYVKQ